MDGTVIENWMRSWTNQLVEQKEYLNELDTVIGDGDHGTNMERGAKAVQELFTQDFKDGNEMMHKIAMTLLTKVGGASGVIYGTAFLEMSKQMTILPMLQAGVAGIEKRGKAELGDKTLLDVWVPLTQKIEVGELTDAEITAAVQATKPLVAKKGRAEFVGEASIGQVDPGAVSSGYLFQSLLQELEK